MMMQTGLMMNTGFGAGTATTLAGAPMPEAGLAKLRPAAVTCATTHLVLPEDMTAARRLGLGLGLGLG